MAKKNKTPSHGKTFLLVVAGFVLLGAIVYLLTMGKDFIILNPKGIIAEEQLILLVHSTLIMLIIAVPTLTVLYFFAWRYREENNNTVFTAHNKNKKSTSFMIWAMPTVIMIMLASIMLPATQKLEPQRRIESDKETMTVQVVALRWKWLFIYPEQNIATVNYAQIPVDVPVQFELTADETPMSSFWIPHLGGMLYAMTEHYNRLNLMAHETGDFEGSAAEINGAGFATMRFNTRVSTQEEFDAWADSIEDSSAILDEEMYKKLLEPSEKDAVALYSNPNKTLFEDVLAKYAGNSHNHYTAEIKEHEGAH